LSQLNLDLLKHKWKFPCCKYVRAFGNGRKKNGTLNLGLC